ncbi:MAG: methyltransferase domain-containing protein [Micromonosporaceae bacterium]|nr:methyltransferase domain-containing protein [Micromonosporaceae bacterium]
MGEQAGERLRLRGTFDEAAERYHRARPSYPERLFDDVERLAGLSSGSSLLEIGCGTGKATLPLARRGHDIVALELGRRLAEQASRNLAGLPNVTVVHASFDDWEHERGGFDLVFAATAWHWLDPDGKHRRAWGLLRPGGHLAFWSAVHVFPDHGDPFFREIQPVYDAIGHGLPADATWPRPGELPETTTEIEASGLFDEVRVRHYDWEVRYDADSYIELLRTFSGHMVMTQRQQDHLYDEIRARLADRPDRQLRRHWGAALHVARSKPRIEQGTDVGG